MIAIGLTAPDFTWGAAGLNQDRTGVLPKKVSRFGAVQSSVSKFFATTRCPAASRARIWRAFVLQPGFCQNRTVAMSNFLSLYSELDQLTSLLFLFASDRGAAGSALSACRVLVKLPLVRRQQFLFRIVCFAAESYFWSSGFYRTVIGRQRLLVVNFRVPRARSNPWRKRREWHASCYLDAAGVRLERA
ncbi:hypothetical protein AOQ71_02110 [Bradyrhizobium manausense]|uniref:Uncharacterized protein n=1 Tax=Bradyrhizobium manausense TaxID=989370 RepID=A0A0R3EB89_9BRAD|nr:hypothetical protein AOQ71_02110 [Bradyrhizobium manausense]